LPAAQQECRSEKDDALRLACYDREVEAQRQSPTTGTAVPASVPATAPPTPEERFGYKDVLAREKRDQVRSETPDLEELVSTVTGVSRRPDGALVITLENGQVWGQKTPDSDFRIRIGKKARIKPSAMGSYFLYGNSNWSTRVSRLH
jgi:hypothetical protein